MGVSNVLTIHTDPSTLSSSYSGTASTTSPVTGVLYRGLVDSNYLYLPKGSNGYFIFDITDISAPVAKSNITIVTNSMALIDNYLYTGNGTSGIGLYNVFDKEFPYSSD